MRPPILIVALALQLPAQELGGEDLDRWLEFLRPSTAEAAWQQIPWRATLRDALLEADRTGKPVLAWIMDGHPMGAT